MITFGHAEFAQLILEVFALLQDRALLRGLSRKKLIVNARSAGIIISLEPVYAMTYAWWWLHGAPSYRMLTGAVLTGAVLIVLSIVLSAQSAGNRVGPIAERLLYSPMVISPRLVIIRVGQITGASCFSKNSQDSHRYVESLRPVYRFAETPIGTALINSLFGLRLGASFSKHPMHALKCAPNVAIHWK
ncbi:hypothetical protein [Pseudomonas sp. H2_D07]